MHFDVGIFVIRQTANLNPRIATVLSMGALHAFVARSVTGPLNTREGRSLVTPDSDSLVSDLEC